MVTDTRGNNGTIGWDGFVDNDKMGVLRSITRHLKYIEEGRGPRKALDNKLREGENEEKAKDGKVGWLEENVSPKLEVWRG